MNSKITIAIFAVIAAYILGIITNDIPFFSLEQKIRPFEVLTFISVTLFGYWFQHSQRKINTGASVKLKLLEETSKEIFTAIDIIISIIEECEKEDTKNLGDNQKKIIHSKIRNISFGIEFVSKKSSNAQLTNDYILYKDKILSEEFSSSKFQLSPEYLRTISTGANEFKRQIRYSICDYLESL